MTHTLHRQGGREALNRDFVITSMGARGINVPGTRERMQKFYEIVTKYNPIFMGDAAKGNQITLGLKDLIEGIDDKTVGEAVFGDAETVTSVLIDLADAGFDRSVVVSGLFDEVEECCQRAGLGTPHTIEWSLGIWGDTENLPPPEDMELTTMCGHAQVPATLVRHMAEQVRQGRLTAVQAGQRLGRQCTCGVFNVARAAELVLAMAGK